MGLATAVIGASTAHAEIIETSSMDTSYSYQVRNSDGTTTGGFANTVLGPDNVTVERPNDEFFVRSDNSLAEAGLQYTSSLTPDGNFSFRHNAYCIGDCQVNITTYVQFNFQNTDSVAKRLRIDSLITPGMLASTRGTTDDFGQFDFTVSVDGTSVYAAVGKALDQGINHIYGTSFNDTTTQSDGSWAVKQWGATPLSIEFTAAANSVTTVGYSSLVRVDTGTFGCTILTDCSGFQVAFGDPRSIGVGIPTLKSDPLSLSGFKPLGLGSTDGQAVGAVGQLFDPFGFNFNLVEDPDNTPFTLAVPPAKTPATVTTGFVSEVFPNATGAVPEPATWAMLILGFGMVGGAMRGSRRKSYAGALAVG